MKNFEKTLKEGGENNERFAEMESVAIIKRVHGSSLAAMGIFEFVSSESAFIAKELANSVIERTNLPLKAVEEIKTKA
ncbi:hypothetical protein GW819_00255 [Candidatus Gracilibacteria bacterium]|nr:hypothetical protein [Candidatus Gracilibacteria bacterium]OIO76582.1 MAG: hypothetical protein AUJ87_02535 [Candidatus Gracilibacteria bacterium CG1_02_38_174]PIQ12026.1 MAG: hypothetical protein COW68_01160 [Candidatus Gracilibacteria bacterium CG18_big_fil_WC_8_21_14_2_50_38_16]PIQ41895.1 MAG: hypothetical protein COW06_01455 [Candidatus Gracilibacteria bacterium CG12_big_fil_rev_8_21_14_0_65_38_15]